MTDTLHRLRGLTDMQIAAFFVVREIITVRGRPVCPDDPALYKVLRSKPRRVRQAIMDLVWFGLLKSGAGYLSVAQD